MTETVRLHLRLLGPFEATLHTPDGRTVTVDVSGCRALVKVALGVLVYDGQPDFTVETNRLIRVLWEEMIEGPGEVSYAGGIETHRTGDEIARSRLTRLLNEMRSMLGTGPGGKTFLTRSEGTVELVEASSDLAEFDRDWEAGRYEAARETAERGAFLAGVQIQRRNESAQRWLEYARESWSRRVEGLFQKREAELTAAGEQEEAALLTAARHTVALAHGLHDLAEKAQQDMRRQEGNGSALGDWGAEPASEPAGWLPVELEALAASGTAARVALLCGDPSIRGRLHASAPLATNGFELSLPKGASRPFGHGRSLRAGLANATHCLYVLAEGEQPNSGWAAFSAALAAEAEVPFRAVTLAGEEMSR